MTVTTLAEAQAQVAAWEHFIETDQAGELLHGSGGRHQLHTVDLAQQRAYALPNEIVVLGKDESQHRAFSNRCRRAQRDVNVLPPDRAEY